MGKLRLAQVGCGGMGLRHVYGLIELRERGFDTFDLTAICDRHSSTAGHVAKVAQDGLGIKPVIYTDFHDMLDAEPSLDAVNIVTDTRVHQSFALAAFDAGLHVAVEKPMALTVRACLAMIEAAADSKRILSVSENYRRDPMNRLTKALLENGIIGDIRLAINISTAGGEDVRQAVAWRHLKNRGGLILEYGVHTSDLTLYFMGDVERVYAETDLWQKTRIMAEPTETLRSFYHHRVKEEIEESMIIQATAEDTGLAVLRFTSGAVGQTTYSDAAPGESLGGDVIYGSEGSLRLPGSRSGSPVRVTLSGRSDPIDEDDLLKEVPGFRLDDVTSRIFGGKDKMSRYDLPFQQPDSKLIAIELQDFADSIVQGRDPEVTGTAGLDALALSYAILESGHLEKPVLFDDVRNDRISSYQHEINESLGI